jgi:iron complex outermembrane recepter protein
MTIKEFGCLGVALFVCTAGSEAVAQSSPAGDPSASATGGLQEIVVTARRRAENVEDVPVTVQVISAQELIDRGIHSETELQTAVPGLVVRANNSQNQLNYVLRGESTEPYSGSVPGVQTYLNEVALSGVSGVGIYDLQGVQVLKGPQGTLFGRNSTGGAVLYQSTQPTNEFGGYVSVQYGNYAKVITEGALNIPMLDDRVILRLSGSTQSGGAFERNIYDGSTLGNTTLNSGRATLLVKLTSAITNTTTVQYSDWSGTDLGFRLTYIEPCSPAQVGAGFTCWANPGNAFFNSLVHDPTGTHYPGYPNGYVYPGGYPTILQFLAAQRKFTVDLNSTGDGYSAKDTTVINTTNFALSDSANIKNIFGYSKTTREMAYDNDATPYPFLSSGDPTSPGTQVERKDATLYSDELQLQGDVLNKRLNYIAGFFFGDNKLEQNSPIQGLGYIPSIDFAYTFAARYRFQSEDKSYAFFTQETYKITDRLNFTAGARVTRDDLSLTQLDGSVFYPAPEEETNETQPSWTFSLDYKLTPDLLLYITQRGSWRVGGFNGITPPINAPAGDGGNYFPPETIRDVEVGSKYEGKLGGMPVRLNLDVFNNWIKDIQHSANFTLAGVPTSATTSVPAGQVFGVEADLQVQPTSWLTAGAIGTYQNGKYTDDTSVLFGTVNVYGPYSNTPRWSGTAYADVTMPTERSGTFRFHADVYGTTYYHMSDQGYTTNPGDTLPGYGVVNLRVDWEDAVRIKGLTASVYVKNVGDKEYFVGGNDAVQSFSESSGIFGQPRTYGGVLRYAF